MNDRDYFEYVIELPDIDLTRAAQSLIGFDQRYSRMEKDLGIISDPDSVLAWAQRAYGTLPAIVDLVSERYPLFILEGDVGTGKTAFARGAANKLLASLKKQGTLFALSTRVRGGGRVGEASSRINAAFDIVVESLGKLKTCILLIDEADSLVTSRGDDHVHLEDKVAVNTIIQKVDDLRRHRGRLIVFLATNRVGSLDAAVVRRAAAVETFVRPGDQERLELLLHDLAGLALQEGTFIELVRLTGPQDGRPGFTFSDFRTRLLPRIVAAAYPTRLIRDVDVLEVARQISPSPIVA